MTIADRMLVVSTVVRPIIYVPFNSRFRRPRSYQA